MLQNFFNHSGNPLSFITSALEVAGDLGDRHQQAQITRSRLSSGNDGGQLGVNFNFQDVDLLFSGNDLVSHFQTELGQRVDGMACLRFHQTTQLQNAG